jgi:hypothetical protein
VSNSRRGLLAAGLAVAVVGSMGTVWTLNANADETAAAEAPAAEAPAAEAPAVDAPAADSPAAVAPVTAASVSVPPKLLPWGTRPERLKRARAGANSAAVAAAGADAAPADKSGSMTPTAEYAPKGGRSRGSFVKTMHTTVVPPAPPAVGAAQAAAADRVVNFHYVVGAELGETDGTWANLTVEKPKLVEGDYHTLAELAVQSADTQQTVEVGWNVDRSVNGDDDPHLFVFYWKDGKRTCYNSCGWTQYSKTVKPGDTLPVGAQKRFGIQHSNNAWWIAYDSEWIGYFSDKNWEGRYTKGGVTQWFGEVAAATLTPCTQMGNGLGAGSGGAARIGSISMTNGPAVKFDLDARPKMELAPDVTYSPYTYNARSDTTFRYGGPVYPLTDPENPNSDPIVKC